MTIARLGGGHTMADLVVVAPAPDGEAGPMVVFTGDLVEESGDPCIDADSDLQAWPATLDRVLAVGGPDAIYVPGHGSVVDAAVRPSPARLVAATCAPRNLLSGGKEPRMIDDLLVRWVVTVLFVLTAVEWGFGVVTQRRVVDRDRPLRVAFRDVSRHGCDGLRRGVHGCPRRDPPCSSCWRRCGLW